MRAEATIGKEVQGHFPGSSWMKPLRNTRETKVSPRKEGEDKGRQLTADTHKDKGTEVRVLHINLLTILPDLL